LFGLAVEGKLIWLAGKLYDERLSKILLKF
jgi:hypothetical protein